MNNKGDWISHWGNDVSYGVSYGKPWVYLPKFISDRTFRDHLNEVKNAQLKAAEDIEKWLAATDGSPLPRK